MKIAALETGVPPAPLADEFGSYPAMFADLLGDGYEIDTFDVTKGEYPQRGEYPAFLVTGSPAGVYEELPWIAPLLEFIRDTREQKMIGVCFGHQAMAQALGGTVVKSEKGWGAGLHRYWVTHEAPWIHKTDTISIPASHQDQVVVQPPSTDVVAASPFTAFAALAWKDRPAISFQFHPEFTPAYAKALIEKRYDRVNDPEQALASLDEPNDNQRIATWIRRFLESPSP